MQYAMMIYAEPGYAEALSDAERDAVVAGSRPWLMTPLPRRRGAATGRNGDLRAHGRWPDADDRRPVRRHQGGARRLRPDRGGQLGRGDRTGGAHAGRSVRRRGGGPADGAALTALEDVFRDEWGRVLASLVGFLGDFDRAEDAAQEAFAIAAERWPSSGVPANPGAWLTTTARNRAIDRIRRERTLAEKIHLLPVPEAVDGRVRRDGDQGRAARADLHLLPPGAAVGGAGGAHPARLSVACRPPISPGRSWSPRRP